MKYGYILELTASESCWDRDFNDSKSQIDLLYGNQEY